MEKAKKILKQILRNLLHILVICCKFIKQKAKDFPYITKSLLLHLFILILVSGLLPKCSPELEKPKIIEVNIVQGAAVEQPKPKVQKQKAKPKAPKKVDPPKEKPKPKIKKEQPKPKPKPVETKKKEEVKKKTSDLPSIKKEQVKPKPEKKKEPKKDDKKDVKQEAKEEKDGKKSLLKDLEKRDSLDDIIEKISKEEPKEKDIKKTEPQESSNTPDELTLQETKELGSLIEKVVRGQMVQCWSIPIGAKNVRNMYVELYIKLGVKGDVRQVRIVDSNKYETDNNYRVLADSAVWAVKECSPLTGLPEDKHKFWKEIQLKFDPRSVL